MTSCLSLCNKLFQKRVNTCDKFQRGISEVFLSFPGGFLKMYRIYMNILHSFPGDFKILVKNDTVMCLSIGTPKITNFPFVPNGKLIIFRCPRI